jgi:hypothetical protein
MYSELLGRLCADLDPVRLPRSQDQLVVILLQHRRGRTGHASRWRDDLTEDLALELDQDHMLLRLCAGLGIEADAAFFAYPRSERERLVRLLGEAGVDFWTLADDHRLRIS